MTKNPVRNRKQLTICLFANRHKIPGDPAPLYKHFSFQDFSPTPAPPTEDGHKDMEKQALDHLKKGLRLNLYVTGLTAALTHFLAFAREMPGRLVLYHYDESSDGYKAQLF